MNPFNRWYAENNAKCVTFDFNYQVKGTNSSRKLYWRSIMFSYQTFLDEKNVLTFEKCQEYYQKILFYADKNNSEFISFWTEFLKEAIEYTQIRASWRLISDDERRATDSSRSVKHDKVIFSLKLAIRTLERTGADISWFDEIVNDRKKIGDFANYITYIYALNGRS